MNMRTTSAPQPPHIVGPEAWYRQFWPWFLISLPASIVVACTFMIYMAISSPFALVADNYYKEGLGINRNLDEARLAQQLGIEASIRVINNRMQIDLSSAFTQQAINQPQLARSLRVEFIHPTDALEDTSLLLLPMGSRRFESNLPTHRKDADLSGYRVRVTGDFSDEKDWVLAGRVGGASDGQFIAQLSAAKAEGNTDKNQTMTHTDG